MSATIQGRKIGNIVITFGTFTHATGAAAFTVKVAGRVFGAMFQNLDSSGEHDVEVPYSVSQDTITGVSTITVYCNAAVTTGRLLVFHSG